MTIDCDQLIDLLTVPPPTSRLPVANAVRFARMFLAPHQEPLPRRRLRGDDLVLLVRCLIGKALGARASGNAESQAMIPSADVLSP
jgi:hypothetical protein